MATKVVLISLFVFACLQVTPADARKAQPGPVEKNFGVGDLVYKEDIKEPLPNAFGGNDIFGRKRTRGMIELRYQGLMQDGRALFYRRDVSLLTNETTMN